MVFLVLVSGIVSWHGCLMKRYRTCLKNQEIKFLSIIIVQPPRVQKVETKNLIILRSFYYLAQRHYFVFIFCLGPICVYVDLSIVGTPCWNEVKTLLTVRMLKCEQLALDV